MPLADPVPYGEGWLVACGRRGCDWRGVEPTPDAARAFLDRHIEWHREQDGRGPSSTVDGTYRLLAAAVLVAHQRTNDSGCLCGRLQLGESWSEHVAQVLDDAGALR